MVALDVINDHARLVDDVSLMAVADITDIFNSLVGSSLPDMADGLTGVFSHVVDPYAVTSGNSTLELLMLQRGEATTRTLFTPDQSRVLPDYSDLDKIVSWVVSAYRDDNVDVALSRLSAKVKGKVYDSSRSVTADVVNRDRDRPYYQRITSPGCCAFCGMVAGFNRQFYSARAAVSVTGRSAYYSRAKERMVDIGRIGKTRGNQGLGERYHTHCKCRAITVYKGQEQDLGAHQQAYTDAFEAAAREVSESQPDLRGKDKQTAVLALMRKQLGVA